MCTGNASKLPAAHFCILDTYCTLVFVCCQCVSSVWSLDYGMYLSESLGVKCNINVAAAMELVAMELKQSGSFIARTLSYEVRS